MRAKKPRSRNVPNPVARGFPPCYEPSFKKSVILYAEQKNNQDARKRFGISEETIRRWRKQKKEILEQAEQSIRRSQRRTVSQGSFVESPHYRQEKNVEDADEDPPTPDLDSMPLQQRLSQNHNESSQAPQESVLQSLPISPTKLKVTRQGKPAATQSTPPPAPQEVCLKWNSHHTNMQSAFPSLLTKGQYVDATLVAEGRTLKCHKMILSSCSPYFEEVLNGIGPLEHPVLFMNLPFWVLESLCAFMYAGEVHIMQDQLADLLNAATSLKIKGLANSTSGQSQAPSGPQIKQELRAPSPTATSEKTVKEEKEEEPKLVKPEVKSSKKKEDKRMKHSSQAVKEKLPEAPPLKLPPRFAKTTVRNVIKAIEKPPPRTLTTRSAIMARRSDPTRRSEKYKPEPKEAQREKDKEKPRHSLRKGNINDPLDLLQPLYEEIAKVPPPPAPVPLKNASVGKTKEKGLTVRRSVGKRMKKRKYDFVEDRDESPPPDFQSRKGTRSRPQVKIPKFFHSHFEDSPKDSADATIVREPHTDQNDPLIGVEVEEIKAEPLDVDDNALEVEEGNLVNYMVQVHEMAQEGEEIIGNYDSPLVNIKRETTTKTTISKLLPSPVIVDVHTVAESDGSLLTIKKENVEIVDISKINSSVEEETIIGKSGFDSDSALSKTTQIIISHVQSMAEVAEEIRSKEESQPAEAAEPQLNQKDPEPCEPDPLAPTGDQQMQLSTKKTAPDNNTVMKPLAAISNQDSGQEEAAAGGSGSLSSLEAKLELVSLSHSSNTEQMSIEDVALEHEDELLKDPSSPGLAGVENVAETQEPNLPSKPEEVVVVQTGQEQSALTLAPLEEWPSNDTPVEPMSISQDPAGFTEICASLEDPVGKSLLEPVAEKIDKIEAELEECLASTSDMVPEQLVKPFEDNEDFSRDIEFSSFINKNNYLDYDFVTDVEMDVKNDLRAAVKQDEQSIAAAKRPYSTDLPADEADEKAAGFHDENRLEFEHNSINQLENNQDFVGCAEDAQQFLAGLDDDIIMNSVASQQQEEGPEKTLEMIVNDLNESLGE